ncbi:MAG: MipA/OmpV family protein [Thermodesulfobacteriota bacterium]|nr:MipA/OmpV family protein [Thermodesulfobacteriota bacterium]
MQKASHPKHATEKFDKKGALNKAMSLLTLGLMLILMPVSSAAEDTSALVPLPSIFDFTRGTGWGVALGVGMECESAYDGADEYEFEVDPAGAIHWRTGNHLFFWEGMELGWRSRMADLWLLQVAARYESGREADDSDDGRLDGLDDQDDELVGVVEIRWSPDSEWRNWLAGRIMAGRSDIGVLGVLAAGHRFGSESDGTGTEVFVFSTFADSDFINRDFGVTAHESFASGLAQTDMDGGYRSTGITLIDRRYLSDHIHIISEAGIELYSSDIQDSPIAREDYEMEVGLSVVYHF